MLISPLHRFPKSCRASSLARLRVPTEPGLGRASSEDKACVQFCAEKALQPGAQRPVLWFSVLFHVIFMEAAPLRPVGSSADATVTPQPWAPCWPRSPGELPNLQPADGSKVLTVKARAGARPARAEDHEESGGPTET